MNDRRSHVLAVAVTASACAALVGCAPDAAPTPTPQATFATEEEAFAAAEAVYREYIDASNSGEDGLQFLAGEMYEGELEAIRSREERGVTLAGETNLVSFAGSSLTTDAEISTVEAAICIDISQSVVLDSSGNDITPTDLDDFWLFTSTFSGNAHELLLVRSDLESSGDQC